MAEQVFNISDRNVADAERWISTIFGSALAAYGLKARSGGGLVLAALGGVMVFRGATGHCPLYASLGVSTVDEGGDQVSVAYGKGTRVEKTVTINAPRSDVYAFWRNFENLPRFMHNLESVQVRDSKRSYWVAKGPAGSTVDWEAEIINEVPGELIGWRSMEGSQIDNAGSVHFSDAARGGTELRVVLRYDPPGGVVGTTISKILGEDPAVNVREDLGRLKTLLETGDIATKERDSTEL